MRGGLFCIGFLALLACSGAPASADALADCQQTIEWDRRITGCTEIIGKGGAPGLSLPAAYNYRGFAHMRKGDYDRALADNSEAIRLDPKFARAHSGRGLAYIEKRNYDRAVADLSEAIRLDPKLVVAYNNRGWAYVEKGEPDRAIADLNEAIKLDPKYAPAHSNRGWAYNDKRDHDRALVDLNEALKLDAKFAPAYNNRGNAYRAKNDPVRAIADYTEAIRLEPKRAHYYNNRGIAQANTGAHDRAIADFTEAIRLEPALVRAHLNRGDSYRARGERDKALADYRRVVGLAATTAADRQRQEAARERIARLTEPKAVQPVQSRRVALVIGNSKYAHAGVLTNPRNDAVAVAAVLRRLAFTDVAELYDLDHAAMGRALRDFGDRASGAEWAVVFFAGHGIEINGTSYLVPVDALLKRDTHVVDETLSLDRVQAKVDAASKFGLVILDACRNNPFAARMVRTAGAVRSVGRGLGSVEPEGNVLVAYSAKHGTVAEDGAGRHSPFTEALLAHIEEPGLEVSILFRKVRDQVRAKTQRRQDPFVYGSLGGELLFFKGAAAR